MRGFWYKFWTECLGAALLLLLIVAIVCLSGCGWDTRSETGGTKTSRTVTITTTQQITPDGQIVSLTTKTTTIVDEQTGATTSTNTEVQPPQIVGSLASVLGGAAKIAATAAGGPTIGAAASAGIDWLTTTLAGGGAAATAAATGYAAIHRPAQARRRRLEEELEAEREERERQEKALRQTTRGVEAFKRTIRDRAPTDPTLALFRSTMLEATDEDVRHTIKQAKVG